MIVYMHLLLTILYSLPFLLAAHFCLSSGLMFGRTENRVDSSISTPNSKLIKSLLLCTGMTELSIFVILVTGWFMDLPFVYYSEALPWIFSAMNWCLVWHSGLLWKNFIYRLPSSSYQVAIDDMASGQPDGVPVRVRDMSAISPRSDRHAYPHPVSRDAKGRFSKKSGV